VRDIFQKIAGKIALGRFRHFESKPDTGNRRAVLRYN
jgi:hypothetical protein